MFTVGGEGVFITTVEPGDVGAFDIAVPDGCNGGAIIEVDLPEQEESAVFRPPPFCRSLPHSSRDLLLRR